MKQIKIEAFAEGVVYPLDDQKINQIASAGWTSIILGLFHPHQDGTIYFNDTTIINNGVFIGDKAWPSSLSLLKGKGNLESLSASIGGGGVGDFKNIKNIYDKNNSSFEGTQLQKNFQTLKSQIGAIDIIDMDCEDLYDQNSFVAFCEMLIQIGFKISFCPYCFTDFWVGSLAAIEKTYPGSVVRWNLQCYDGGTGNNPQVWAKAIRDEIPDFNTTNFIIAGDWTNDTPKEVTSLFSKFENMDCAGGGFLWTLDAIYPDEMSNYINAIKEGFN
jgi:hypothetical protein